MSRVYRWDLRDDTFEPGQWLKARANVLGISHDGKYYGYFAEAFSKRELSYLAVAHNGFFTALVFQQTFHLSWHHVVFSKTDLVVGTSSYRLTNRPERKVEVPGCPYRITYETDVDRRDLPDQTCDTLRGREFRVVEDALMCGEKLVARFPRDAFAAVSPPDWAKVW